MSVLIKGIELPEKVQVLELHHDGKVFTRKGYLVGEAVELPDHHGRLVEFIDVVTTLDEDSGTEEVCFGDIMRAYYEMRNAPTIVEAEDSE